jgi:serine/threonine-protein kinase RsbW
MTSRHDSNHGVTDAQEIRQLTVLGRYGYSSIPTITQFVAEAARSSLLDEDSVFHCQMAVDEACTNVIEHAYGEENVGNIEISCVVQPGRCTIRIIDHGVPFDPTAIPTPPATTNLDNIRPGGIGLHLMKQLMDEVNFEFSTQGNILTMVKTSPQPTQPQSPADIPVRHDKRGIWVVAPRAQIDSLMAAQFDETITKVIDEGRYWIVVDLAEVSYISSRGLKALISGWRKTQDHGGLLVLCSIAPRVQSIIDTIGFNQIIEIFSNLDDALKAVAARRAGSSQA